MQLSSCPPKKVGNDMCTPLLDGDSWGNGPSVASEPSKYILVVNERMTEHTSQWMRGCQLIQDCLVRGVEAVLTRGASLHVAQPLLIPTAAATWKYRPNVTAGPHFQKNLEIWSFMGKSPDF